jgi:transposase
VRKSTGRTTKVTIGLDLGDRFSCFCILDAKGSIVEEDRVATTPAGLRRRFRSRRSALIVIEAGSQSPWVSRLLAELGHEVLVANPSRLRLIYENRSKSDRVDARFLARLARADRKLLSPIQHRSEQAQQDQALLRSRDALVRTRTTLINHVRGIVKGFGIRIPKVNTIGFHKRATPELLGGLHETLTPALETIGAITVQIKALDKRLEDISQLVYPETQLLRQVPGVGPLVALAFVLSIEDPDRFAKSRTVGPFLGLVPRRDQSGDSDPERRITKQGDGYVRRLLVQAAHYILGPFGPDSDLRRYGSRIAAHGGKNAKKRAVVAVARKLAVLLHRLWKTAELYEPLRTAAKGQKKAA